MRSLPFIALVGLMGCSEYQVHRMSPAQKKANWFDEARLDDQDGDSSDSDSDSDTEEGQDDEDRWSEDEQEEGDGGGCSGGSGYDDDDDDDGEYWGESDDDESSSGGSSSGSSGSGSSGSSSGCTDSSPRAPHVGEVVISEMMVDPDSVEDRHGEWVEIHNITSHWLDLSGYRLADGDVDDMEIDPVSTGSLVVEPDGRLVICANDDFWDNGGVDCDGTFRWWTFGDGFAMSNTEDEVLLLDSHGTAMDRVRWVDDFVEVGSAMGLDPDEHTISRNDDLTLWCDQWSWLPLGDSGTPGEENDPCW